MRWRPDRDIVAVKNLSPKGPLRFGSSLPYDNKTKGGAAEAMRGNPLPVKTEAILGVDAQKSGQDEGLTGGTVAEIKEKEGHSQ